jgi:hypothetical protein
LNSSAKSSDVVTNFLRSSGFIFIPV